MLDDLENPPEEKEDPKKPAKKDAKSRLFLFDLLIVNK